MTVEEKKIILKDYKHIADRVDSLNRQLARWRSVAYSLSSPMGASARGGDNYKLETVIDRIGEIEQELLCNIKELSDLELRIRAAVRRLNDKRLADIITIRYIDGVSDWDLIADTIGYSRKQTLRLHGKALLKINLSA